MLAPKIVVTSRTFAKTPELVGKLREHFSEVKLNLDKKLAGDELADFIGDAEGAIIGLEKITETVLSKCPNLKVISKYGVGLDNIDAEACRNRGIAIGWTGGLNKLSVAEMTIGLMLALNRNLFRGAMRLKSGLWENQGGRELSGLAIGIIGVGNIGKEVVRLLKPFNCRIIVNDIINQDEYYREAGVELKTKEEIFREADVITLHVPLTPQTERMINRDVLASMRQGAYIVNTARGGIIDHSALKEALRSGVIAGAAIDVYDEEPPQDKDLISLENLITTPHIGGNSREAVMALGTSAITHLRNHFRT